jgi:hypothetical protein
MCAVKGLSESRLSILIIIYASFHRLLSFNWARLLFKRRRNVTEPNQRSRWKRSVRNTRPIKGSLSGRLLIIFNVLLMGR